MFGVWLICCRHCRCCSRCYCRCCARARVPNARGCGSERRDRDGAKAPTREWRRYLLARSRASQMNSSPSPLILEIVATPIARARARERERIPPRQTAANAHERAFQRFFTRSNVDMNEETLNRESKPRAFLTNFLAQKTVQLVYNRCFGLQNMQIFACQRYIANINVHQYSSKFKSEKSPSHL